MPEATAGVATVISYRQAVNEALHRALSEFPEAIVFGEDVAIPGGVFGVTKGLRDAFGPRVFDTPISETAMLGAAVGAALQRSRPIVEIMWADFLFVALDQLVNQASTVRYLSRGRSSVPMTIRTQQGAFAASSAHHSRCVESILAHIPGLRIGLPSTPEDAYQMTLTAIADDDPVIVIENRSLYQTQGEVSLGAEIRPIGGASIRRSGQHVTIVALSSMVDRALDAAEQLAAEGISAEVIDPRWISPFDDATIFASVERTGRLIVVHEAVRTAGFGAEIVSRVAEHAFWALDAPVRRITSPDIPKPSAPTLERATLPSAEAIVAAARNLVEV
ncbi:MAG: alpha-ketoacid dehydrogenase subunit beta [Chloroflexi bacterium]|nr:alpha-ketoacid dehydrogenase subunit beta [Chloroflexota bacterium]